MKEVWKPMSRLQIEMLAKLLEKKGKINTFSEITWHTDYRGAGEAIEFRMVALNFPDDRKLMIRGFIMLNEDSIQVLE
jgi:hypothetical protein